MIKKILYSFLLFFVCPPSFVAIAATDLKPLPEDGIQQDGTIKGEKFNFNFFSEEFLNSTAYNIYDYGIKIIYIIFLVAVVALVFGLVNKTGQWIKAATLAMIFSIVSLIVIRLFPLIIFASDVYSVTMLIDDFALMLQYIGYYCAAGLILVGLMIKFYHMMIRHPEFNRWSKRLFLAAIVTILLDTSIQYIF